MTCARRGRTIERLGRDNIRTILDEGGGGGRVGAERSATRAPWGAPPPARPQPDGLSARRAVVQRAARRIAGKLLRAPVFLTCRTGSARPFSRRAAPARSTGRSTAMPRRRKKEALTSKARFPRCSRPMSGGRTSTRRRRTFAAFSAFLDGNGTFFLKPVSGTMGRGIERCRSAAIPDRTAFYDDCRAQRLLLEAPIRQHPALRGAQPRVRQQCAR